MVKPAPLLSPRNCPRARGSRVELGFKSEFGLVGKNRAVFFFIISLG